MCFGGAAILEREKHQRKVMLGAYRLLEKAVEGEEIPPQAFHAVLYELGEILGMPVQQELPLNPTR